MSTWLIVAVVGLVGEMYFFFMQRSALEVCRAQGLPEHLRLALLPGYYRVGRLTTLAKWVGVGALAMTGHWLIGACVIVGAWLVSAVAPVPHAAFFGVFYRELDEPTNRASAEQRGLARTALEAVDHEFGITDRR